MAPDGRFVLLFVKHFAASVCSQPLGINKTRSGAKYLYSKEHKNMVAESSYFWNIDEANNCLETVASRGKINK